MHCFKLLRSWLKYYNVTNSQLATLIIMSWLIIEWTQHLHPQKKRHQFIVLSHLQKSLAPLLGRYTDHILIYLKFCMMPLHKKLATMNHMAWGYLSHITVVDNTGQAWGMSIAIKGNDGVSNLPWLIFLWFYLSFFKFRLAKKLEKQAKNGYVNMTTNFEY